MQLDSATTPDWPLRGYETDLYLRVFSAEFRQAGYQPVQREGRRCVDGYGTARDTADVFACLLDGSESRRNVRKKNAAHLGEFDGAVVALKERYSQILL